MVKWLFDIEEEVLQQIRKEHKQRGFASIAAFIRYAIMELLKK